MNIKEALEIVHQNGIGQDTRCFLVSFGTTENKDCITLINNYKYNKCLIKIYVNQDSLLRHEKNFLEAPNPHCELLIKKSYNKEVITIKLFCKFINIENRLIHVEAKNIKYPDEKKEINKILLVEEKKMGS